jgi:hypothetical protein
MNAEHAKQPLSPTRHLEHAVLHTDAMTFSKPRARPRR